MEELENAQTTPHGKKIAEQFRKGKIKGETLARLNKEVIQNPNRMEDNHYKNLVEAVAKGKFPESDRAIIRIIEALGRSGEEQEAAIILVNKIKEESSLPIDKRKQKKIVNQLDELRVQDAEEAVAEETGDKVHTTVDEAVRSTQAEKVSKKREMNWDIEQPPESDILAQANIKTRELKALQQKQAELIAQQVSETDPEYVQLKEKIKLTTKELNDIDDKIDGTKQNEWMDYVIRIRKQIQEIKRFSARVGMDMNIVSEITRWMLTSSTQSGGKSLRGVEVNAESGEAKRKMGRMKIHKIFFEREKLDLPDSDQAAGSMQIEYSEEGKDTKVTKSFVNFVKEMDALEGYENIKEPEVFDKKYVYELGAKPVESLAGESFEAEIAKSYNEETNKFEYEKSNFTVSSVQNRNGQWFVTLDKPVEVLSRLQLADSVDPLLYFDRNQKEFELGKFGMLLRKRGYQRDMKEEELDEVAAKIQEVRGNTFAFPSGDKESRVKMKDEYGNPTGGVARRIKGENGEADVIELEYPPHGEKSPRITKRMGMNAYMEAQNKGEIEEMEEEEELGSDNIPLPPRPVANDPSKLPPGAPDLSKYGEAAPDEAKTEGQGKQTDFSKKIYEEALSFDEVEKIGGMQSPQSGILKELWDETRVLSVSDIWEWAKAMWEYYDNRFKRRQKEKYSSVGTELPFFAPEMKRINQAAENEQVNQFKESFDQKGVNEIQDRARYTRNRDELKAAVIVLTEKGQMRWDDIDIWRNLNRFVDARIGIPIPQNGDPNTKISDKDDRTGFSFLAGAIDSLWGEGQYSDWYQKNKSTYLSNAKNYYEEGKELEGVQGGHERRMKTLLKMHKEGKYVDSHEYEGLILHAIDMGKSSMQAKVYYMIEGVAAQSPQGRTIMSFDRIAHINSELLPKFPLLEYLTARAERPDGKGGTKDHRFTIEDYRSWIRRWDGSNPMNSEPNPAVDKFMWEYILPSDDTQNRINKAIRSGENLDHDDMFGYLPPATEQVITDTCKSTTGSKKFLTIEGYANAFPGFSQYMRSLSEHDKHKNKLIEAVKSYVRFEGIMTNKFEKAETSARDTYQRLDRSTLNSPTIVSDQPPQAFMNQLNKTMQDIIRAYDDPELKDLAYWIYDVKVGSLTDAAEKQKQNQKNTAFHRFGDVLDRVVKTDNGKIMQSVIAGSDLFGMTYKSSEERDARKLQYSNPFALDE